MTNESSESYNPHSVVGRYLEEQRAPTVGEMMCKTRCKGCNQFKDRCRCGKPTLICKGCSQEIAGFDTEGYCEDCLCDNCGSELETENERTMQICENCEVTDE